MSLQSRVASLITAIGADVKSINTSISTINTDLATNHKWIQMTQAAYDALGTKDPNVLYVIVG